MPNIGPMEIGIVLAIVLVIFGPKRIPDLAKSLGKGVRELKGSLGDGDEIETKPAAPKVVAATPAEVKATEV